MCAVIAAQARRLSHTWRFFHCLLNKMAFQLSKNANIHKGVSLRREGRPPLNAAHREDRPTVRGEQR
jgi:hypothetical protein